MQDKTKQRLNMLDITAPETVDITIRADGKVIWVNVDGACHLRCCRIKHLNLDDQRVPNKENDL